MALPQIPQIAIRDAIQDQLETIRPINNYNTSIQKVFVGKILPVDSFTPVERSALVQMKLVSHGFGGELGTADERLNVFKQQGTLTIILLASMKNKTEEEFWLFLMDIYAALAECSKLVVTKYYKVHDIIVDSIIVDDTEEFDEVDDPLSGIIFEQVAEFLVNVEYIFVPERMSGAAS